ncbi:hypothetical protein CPZ21_00995 [Staphylococcus epidermidis]|uniref:class I SAM-dependent methyltransferase n=1 Tax=Staphylococcus epidermidis TaxID=1282 RepID=UPI000C164F29|nr:class I SAM-dependent methyltransferase [Staphylococcus epidermidis]ATQ58787.1 hypothetical protein CPZ21_00995 [Staphylococcus epidermidis]
MKKIKSLENTVYLLTSEIENILNVEDGRMAIVKVDSLTKNNEKFLIGVGEKFKIESNTRYYIKNLISSTIFTLSHNEYIIEKGESTKEKLFDDIDDYYFGYEDRYRKVYEEGADLWETGKPNESLIKIFEKFPDIFSGQVIDLGCGEGRDTIYLSKNGIDIQGIDISHSAINKAKEKIKECNGDENIFKTGNVLYLNQFNNGTFDLAMNMGCLHMMNKSEDRLAHIKSVYRILSNEGHFLVDHCKSDWGKGFHTIENYDEVKDKIKNFEEEHYIDRTIIVNGTKKKIPLKVIPYLESSDNELINEITSCGFKVIEVFDTDTESFGNSALVLFKKEKDVE